MEDNTILPCQNQALKLLHNNEEFKVARSNTTAFIYRLAEQPALLKDLLDICLRPQYFQTRTGITISPDTAALAIEILPALYQEFIQLLAYDRVLPKSEPLQGLELQEVSSQMQSLAEQNVKRQQFLFLAHIHLCLQQELNQTVYSNLAKLLGPLFYNHPEQIFTFYHANPQAIQLLISKMGNRGIVESFCRLLETESGKQFFKDYKFKYFSAYYQRLIVELSGDRAEDWLECFLLMHKSITERIQQKYEIKYLNLLKEVEEWDLQILAIVSSKMSDLTSQFSLIGLKWIEELLKHDSYVMGSTTNKLTLTLCNRRNSISNNFYSEQKLSKKQEYHLSIKHLQAVAKVLLSIQSNPIIVSQDPRVGHRLITFYRCLYFFVRIWVQTIDKIPSYALNPNISSSQIYLLLNDTFFDKSYKIIMNHPRNTTLHNYVKQLIIECLKESIVKAQYFIYFDNSYRQLLQDSFPRTKTNQNTPFSIQVYHIFKEILNLKPYNPEIQQIQAYINHENQRLTKLIGVDPRKLNGDNLRDSNNAFSESSEEVQFELYSQHVSPKANTGRNFNFSLIRSYSNNTPEKTYMKQVEEEKIVIEGMDDDQDLQ